MTLIEAIIIGLIQGATEFLPISSSGHIMLVERLLGVESDLSFTLMMHLATLCAVVIVMRKQILSALKGNIKWKILLASAMSFLVVIATNGLIKVAMSGTFLAVCFLITAVMLLASGFVKAKKTEINYFDAAMIGLVQGIAVLPGISRSGSTVSAAIMLGNERESSMSFSFLLSIPIILGSALIDFISEGLGAFEPLPIIFGFIAAFASGMVAIKLMLKLTKKSFDFFAIYLAALSLFLILNDLFLHLF